MTAQPPEDNISPAPATAKRARRSRWHPRRLLRHGLIAALALAAGIGLNAVRLGRPFYLANFRVPRVITRMPEPVLGQRIVIFAPHEDDEALGCANYIRHATAAGAQVWLVLMTNGDATELSILYDERTLRRGPKQFLHLGRKRQQETLNAARHLGVPPDHVIFLGYPNNGLDYLWSATYWYPSYPYTSRTTKASASPYSDSYTRNAPYCGSAVVRDIRNILAKLQPDTVLTVMPADIHRDHWPTWCFVARAIAELQQTPGPYHGPAALFTYLIHWYHWPAPQSFHPEAVVEPPASLRTIPYLHWAQVPLTPEEVLAKHNVIKLYYTQAGSFAPVLQAFARSDELYAAIDPAVIAEKPAVPPVPDEPLDHPPLDTLIEDTTADRDSTIIRADLDIAQVSGALDPNYLWLEVQNERPLSPYAQAWVIVVPCVVTPQGSVGPIQVWATRRAGVMQAVRAADGQLRRETVQSVPFSVDGPAMTFGIPRAWLYCAPAMQVSALVTVGNKLMDRAIWRMVYVTRPSAENGPLAPYGCAP
jgi:LmbE family N-acetylglucosaminyl deacetylase